MGAQRTPLQPAAAARTPPSAAVDSPDEPRASPAPAPAPRQPGPELSRQQKQHQRKKFGAHYAAMEEAKAEVRQTAAEMLDMIRETPAPKVGKARFGGNDLRWQLIKELLKGIGEGTDDEPGDPAMREQMLRHLLDGGIGSSKSPRFTEITAGKSGNDARRKRGLAALGMLLRLGSPRARKTPIDFKAQMRGVRAPPKRPPAGPFALYVETHLPDTMAQNECTQEEAMLELGSAWGELPSDEKARYAARLQQRHAAFDAGEDARDTGSGSDDDAEPADESAALTAAELEDITALLKWICRYGVMAGKLSPPLDFATIRSIEAGITEFYRSKIVLGKVRLASPPRCSRSQPVSDCLVTALVLQMGTQEFRADRAAWAKLSAKAGFRLRPSAEKLAIAVEATGAPVPVHAVMVGGGRPSGGRALTKDYLQEWDTDDALHTAIYEQCEVDDTKIAITGLPSDVTAHEIVSFLITVYSISIEEDDVTLRVTNESEESGAALVSVPCAADVLQLSAGQKSRVVPRPEGAASRCDVARWWRTGEQSAVTVRQCRELPLCVWPDWGWKRGPLEGHTLETLRPLIPETANSCVTTALALFRAPCAVLR